MSPQTPDQPASASDRLPRRRFLAGTAAALAAARVRGAPAVGGEPGPKKYRVGVIGHTGRGNYGHGLDRVWLEIPGAEIVGVADANPAGLVAAVKRLDGPKGFADYRKMLEEMKPELVSICPRHLDQHHDMVIAAIDSGVRGIYLEKPFCRTLVEADAIVAACEKNKVKLALAHQTRYSQKLPVIWDVIRSGRLGRIVEFRARGKNDRRGGGEDLWVLGTHMLNLMSHFGGDPQWCFARVWQGGRPVTAADVEEGAEGIGPLAGDEVHAMYGLDGGFTGYFDSIRDTGGRPTRFGLSIYGSKGIIELYNTGHIPTVLYLDDSSWTPGRSGKEWVEITSAGVDKPEPLEDRGLHGGNVLAVKDLIAAVEEERQPVSSVYEARAAVEMIVAVFESHRTGGAVEFPLATRENPLTLLE